MPVQYVIGAIVALVAGVIMGFGLAAIDDEDEEN